LPHENFSSKRLQTNESIYRLLGTQLSWENYSNCAELDCSKSGGKLKLMGAHVWLHWLVRLSSVISTPWWTASLQLNMLL